LPTVKYQLTRDELVSSAFRRKVMRPRFLALLAILLLAGFAMLAMGDVLVYVGAFCIAYAFLAPLQLFLALDRFVKGTAWLTAPTTVDFDETGLTISAPGHRFQLAWPSFHSWWETERHVFVSPDQAGETAITIPKGAFAPRELEALYANLERHVAKAS
jgi:hypothetical protein